MIRIAISDAAFEAIAATMPLGSVAVEPRADGEWRAPDLAGAPFRGTPKGYARARRELFRRDR
jgi:hypothetical protein